MVPPTPSQLDDFNRIQQRRSCNSFSTVKSIADVRTKNDTKLDACLDLLQLSARLKNCVLPHLKECQAILRDGEAKMGKRRSMARDMGKFDLPLVELAVDLVIKAAIADAYKSI